MLFAAIEECACIDALGSRHHVSLVAVDATCAARESSIQYSPSCTGSSARHPASRPSACRHPLQTSAKLQMRPWRRRRVEHGNPGAYACRVPAHLSVSTSALNCLSFRGCPMQYSQDLRCMALPQSLMRCAHLRCHLDLRHVNRHPVSQIREEQEEAGDRVAKQSCGVGGVACVVRSVCLQLR